MFTIIDNFFWVKAFKKSCQLLFKNTSSYYYSPYNTLPHVLQNTHKIKISKIYPKICKLLPQIKTQLSVILRQSCMCWMFLTFILLNTLNKDYNLQNCPQNSHQNYGGFMTILTWNSLRFKVRNLSELNLTTIQRYRRYNDTGKFT